MDDEPFRIATLGNRRSEEMRPVGAWLDDHLAGAELRQADDVSQLIRLVTRDHWFADLVVVCQHWPDEYTAGEVGQLFAFLPLARWVCCYGLWCESDGRTRDIWPGAVRVPARMAAARLQREWEVVCHERPPLPETASRDEIFAFDNGSAESGRRNSKFPFPRSELRTPSILVRSPDRAWRDTLREILTSAGYRISVDERGPFLTAAVWDVDPRRDESIAALQAFRSTAPSVPIIGVMTAPHPEDRHMLRDCGVGRVVSKLGPISEWLALLHRLLQGHAA